MHPPILRAFSSLLQADRVDVRILVVSEAIGGEGWGILAKAIRPEILQNIGIVITRDGLAQGKREDIKDLFDAGCLFQIYKTLEDLQAKNLEASLLFDQDDNDWTRFERVMDMPEQEFIGEVERQEEW